MRFSGADPERSEGEGTRAQRSWPRIARPLQSTMPPCGITSPEKPVRHFPQRVQWRLLLPQPIPNAIALAALKATASINGATAYIRTFRQQSNRLAYEDARRLKISHIRIIIMFMWLIIQQEQFDVRQP